MREVVIVEAVRTAIGRFGGSLSGISAVDLGSHVIREALNRSGLNPSEVGEVIMGNVLQSGLGQNPARQAAVRAGLPFSIPSFTVNKVCGSGLKSISLAALSIAAGETDIIVAGGMENMTQSPYILKQARHGYRMGNGELIDSMLHDGLWDAFYDIHMGITAENVADHYGLKRPELDEYAAKSQKRAKAAQDQEKFKDEVTPVAVLQRKGEPIIMDQDEDIRPDASVDKLLALKPAFQKDGVVTAGNSSGINDGAAAVIVMSKDKADRLGIKPMVRIAGFASAGCDPKMMGMGPVPAIQKLLHNVGWGIDDVDLFEINEAFASQTLGISIELGLSLDKVNVNGGAIALGHPIGASGTRIVVSLLHEMIRRDVKHGLSSLCIGGGQGIAMAFERE